MKTSAGVIATLVILSMVLISMGCQVETTKYDLTVTIVGSGSVSPLSGSYEDGTTVTLTATPDENWRFSEWSGDATGAATSIQVVMNSNRAVVATFTDKNAPNPGCGNSFPQGASRRTINVGGTVRSYIVHIPRGYLYNASPVPLLLDFHPLSADAEYQLENSGTKDLSSQENVIVAYPEGIDNAWNIGPCCTESRSVDDVAFARAIIDDIKKEGCIDSSRVYATGYSNGGGMAYYLACNAADTIAAVAPAAFDLIKDMPCKPIRPVSIFSSRGRFDVIVPYNGGESTPPTSYNLDPIDFLGAVGTFEKWAAINGCPENPQDIGNNCDAYQNCAGDTKVVLCTERFGGHSAWDALEAWEFLKTHTLNGPIIL